MKTYYEILQVSSSASQEVIKAAYQSLSKKYHPDKNVGNSTFDEVMKEINIAYDVLSDSLKRHEYDETVKKQTFKDNANEISVTKPPAQVVERNNSGISGIIIIFALLLLAYLIPPPKQKLEAAAEPIKSMTEYEVTARKIEDQRLKDEASKQLLEGKFKNADNLIVGNGTPQNYYLAISEYKSLLGKFKDGRVERRIGEIYYHGYGVEQDYLKAVNWFKEANKNYLKIEPVVGKEISKYPNGYQDIVSLLILAGIYENGLGVEKSNIKAYRYYNLAASVGGFNYNYGFGKDDYEGNLLNENGIKWFFPFDKKIIPQLIFDYKYADFGYQNFSILKRDELLKSLSTSEINYAQNLSE